MWKRVIAPTAVVSAIWLLGSSITAYHMNALYESQNRAISDDVSTIESAWAMRRDVWKLQASVLEAKYASPDIERAELATLINTFRHNLADATHTSLSPAERAIVKTIGSRFDLYEKEIQQYLEAGEKPKTADQTDRLMALATEVTMGCAELTTLNEQMISRETEANARAHRLVWFFRICFLVLGPLIGVLLGIVTARRLNRSISQIRVTLEDVSGKLGYEVGSVAVTEADQLPALQKQVDRICSHIRGVVRELEQARKYAIQSERLAAVGELAAGVAHEIRNPLTSVKLLIQTASEKHAQSALNERQIDVILGEISRMESMVQGLLDFARPPRLKMVVHDLRQTVRRAINLIHGRSTRQGVEISEHFPDEPVLVNGDPEQLNPVFVNLLINALEAMPAGGQVNIDLESKDDTVCVRFRDSGSGIPADLLDRIFEPFVTNKERGTGLGLAICHRVIAEHSGSIEAENDIKRGAILTLRLPLFRTSLTTFDSAAQPIQTRDVTEGKWHQSEIAHGQITGD